MLASLNHRNIANLYGMEMVERTVGEGSIPSRKAVDQRLTEVDRDCRIATPRTVGRVTGMVLSMPLIAVLTSMPS